VAFANDPSLWSSDFVGGAAHVWSNDAVKDAIERNKKQNWLFLGDVFSQHRGKFLQVHLTIEDAGVFTTPWTATLTYVPGEENHLPEEVCAETSSNTITTTRPTSRAPTSRTSEA
jgi:hypothetical protein